MSAIDPALANLMREAIGCGRDLALEALRILLDLSGKRWEYAFEKVAGLTFSTSTHAMEVGNSHIEGHGFERRRTMHWARRISVARVIAMMLGSAISCGAPAGSTCCFHSGLPGCDDRDCEAAVCAVDPFCCNVLWDSMCADQARVLCKICESFDPCTFSTNDCCILSPVGGPGCNDTSCCTAVCAIDLTCCEITWDALCAQYAQQICTELCSSCPPNSNDCCVASPNGTRGCNDPECCALVCDIDAFCCLGSWDSLCASEAQELCLICQELNLSLDIRPASCPNPLNCNSFGLIVIAVTGSSVLDASSIDFTSVTLARADGVGTSVAPIFGPPGPSPHLADAATPFDGDACQCHEFGPDGIDDLILHFQTQALCSDLQLASVAGGLSLELVLTGLLLDRTPFAASDCVWIVPPAHQRSSITALELLESLASSHFLQP